MINTNKKFFNCALHISWQNARNGKLTVTASNDVDVDVIIDCPEGPGKSVPKNSVEYPKPKAGRTRERGRASCNSGAPSRL